MEDMSDDEDNTTRDERMGDSIIRKIDGKVCSKKTKTTTVCLPGAKVEDVSKRVGKVLGPGKGGGGGGGWGRGGGVYPCTCRVERRRQGRDDGATGELSTVGKGAEGQGNRKIVLSAILPVVGGRTEYRNSRRMAINGQLQRMCDMKEVGFVDVWCRFVGREDLYLRGGLHLTNNDAAVLGDEFLKVMSDSTPFLG